MMWLGFGAGLSIINYAQKTKIFSFFAGSGNRFLFVCKFAVFISLLWFVGRNSVGGFLFLVWIGSYI